MTNLSLIFLLNLIILTVWLGLFNYRIANTYDFAVFNLFKLVQSMVKENLYVKKQSPLSAVLTPLFIDMVSLLHTRTRDLVFLSRKSKLVDEIGLSLSSQTKIPNIDLSSGAALPTRESTMFLVLAIMTSDGQGITFGTFGAIAALTACIGYFGLVIFRAKLELSTEDKYQAKLDLMKPVCSDVPPHTPFTDAVQLTQPSLDALKGAPASTEALLAAGRRLELLKFEWRQLFKRAHTDELKKNAHWQQRLTPDGLDDVNTLCKSFERGEQLQDISHHERTVREVYSSQFRLERLYRMRDADEADLVHRQDLYTYPSLPGQLITHPSQLSFFSFLELVPANWRWAFVLLQLLSLLLFSYYPERYAQYLCLSHRFCAWAHRLFKACARRASTFSARVMRPSSLLLLIIPMTEDTFYILFVILVVLYGAYRTFLFLRYEDVTQRNEEILRTTKYIHVPRPPIIYDELGNPTIDLRSLPETISLPPSGVGAYMTEKFAESPAEKNQQAVDQNSTSTEKSEAPPVKKARETPIDGRDPPR